MPNATRDALIRDAITAGLVHVDPATGLVEIAGRGHMARPDGYLTVSYRGAQLLAHRIMWLYHHPETPNTFPINHRNGSRWDNRLSNLELVTPRGNNQHAATLAYAAVGSEEDDNVVDPDWFAEVMRLAADPNATPEQIRALKSEATIDDSVRGVYRQRPLTRQMHIRR